MKVIRLTAENVLRLRAIDITPASAVVKISGKNGHGKTSTLNCIALALDHRRVKAPEVVRRGAKKATIKLDLGEILVERVTTAKSDVLKVTAADGSDIKSPQKFLDALIGELSFDPLDFDRMAPAEQFEAVRRAVKVTFDFQANTNARQKVYDERTAVNRTAAQQRAEAEAIQWTGGLPLEPIDTAAIMNRIEEAARINADLAERQRLRDERKRDIDQLRRGVADAKMRVETIDAEVAALMAERQRVEQMGADMEEQAKTKEARLANAPALPAPVDVSAERKAYEDAERTNRLLEQNARRTTRENDATLTEQRAAELTLDIERLDRERWEAIAAAVMPVEGLSLGENVVLFKGLPYIQASSAERLRISMGVAMAANPEIRVIRISDATLLDQDSQALITEMALANDFQVWEEIVDRDGTGKIGIVIEDGMVAAVNDD